MGSLRNVTTNRIHWFVIGCGETELTVHRWNTDAANAAGLDTTAVKLMPRCTSAAGSVGVSPAQNNFSVAPMGPGLRNLSQRAQVNVPHKSVEFANASG